MAARRICAVNGCDKPVKARGWCTGHWQRWRKTGDPQASILTPIERKAKNGEPLDFLRVVVLAHGSDDCLIWPFGRDSSGYARIWTGTKAENACRLVCEEREGPPPTPKHEAAHSCGRGHEGCVAPSHLRWASHIENMADRSAHHRTYRGGNRPRE